MPIHPKNQHSNPSLQPSGDLQNQNAATGTEHAPMASAPSLTSKFELSFDDEFERLYQTEIHHSQLNATTPIVYIKAYDATSINVIEYSAKILFNTERDARLASKCLFSIMTEKDYKDIATKLNGKLTLCMLSNIYTQFDYFSKLKALNFNAKEIIEISKHDSAHKTLILLNIHYQDFINLNFDHNMIKQLCCIHEAHLFLAEILNYFETISTDPELHNYHFQPSQILSIINYEYPAKRLRHFISNYPALKILLLNERITTKEIIDTLTINNFLYVKRAMTIILNRSIENTPAVKKKKNSSEAAKRKHHHPQMAQQQKKAQKFSGTVLNPMKISTLLIDQAMQNPHQQMTLIAAANAPSDHASPVETYETTLSTNASHEFPTTTTQLAFSMSEPCQEFSSHAVLTSDLIINDDFEQLYQSAQQVPQNSGLRTTTGDDLQSLQFALDMPSLSQDLSLLCDADALPQLSSQPSSMFYTDTGSVNEQVENSPDRHEGYSPKRYS